MTMKLELAEHLPGGRYWGIGDIAQAAEVTVATVTRWRWADNQNEKKGLVRERDWVPYLPAPHTRDGRMLLWRPETVVRHLMQTARLTPAQRAPLKRHRSGGLPGASPSPNLVRGPGGQLMRRPDGDGHRAAPPRVAPDGADLLVVNPLLRERDQEILMLRQADAAGWLTYLWVDVDVQPDRPDTYGVLVADTPGRRRHSRLVRLRTGEVRPFVLGLAVGQGAGVESAAYRPGLVDDSDTDDQDQDQEQEQVVS